MADKDFLMKRWTVTVRWSKRAVKRRDRADAAKRSRTHGSDVFQRMHIQLSFCVSRPVAARPDPEWWGAEIESA